jgi:hypothetical protein
MTAGFALASRFRVISPSSGHGQDYTADALAGEIWEPKLARIFLLWQGPRATQAGYTSRRRSSVVEHVIGNDGVDCSIQSGGTIKSVT